MALWNEKALQEVETALLNSETYEEALACIATYSRTDLLHIRNHLKAYTLKTDKKSMQAEIIRRTFGAKRQYETITNRQFVAR